MKETLLAKYSYWSDLKEAVLIKLGSSVKGLSTEESGVRLRKYGANLLPHQRRKSFIVGFLSRFFDPLILLLLIACILAAIVGSFTNFVIIFILIFISVSLDFFQEYQAENAVEKLKRRVSSKAKVLRDSKIALLGFDDLVPGDIVLLSSGDVVPADGRLIEASNLSIDQSVLTGESFPQEKFADKTYPSGSRMIDFQNCVFMGTNVVAGEGKFIVVRTGGLTEFGKVAKDLAAARAETQFHTGIKHFGFMLTKVTLILVVFVFLANVLIRHEMLNPLLFSLALAIGMAPELLPVILTINLAKGATKMAKKEMIVKNLASIENFGSIQILCTDKTGTFTEGKTEVSGYENVEGKKDEQLLLFAYLTSVFESGFKNVMSTSILKYIGEKFNEKKKDYQKLAEVPFDFDRKRMSIAVSYANEKYLITRGAPEGILEVSIGYLKDGKGYDFGSITKKQLLDRFEFLSRQGYRVLAVAKRKITSLKVSKSDEGGLYFMGFIIYSDVIKKSAKEAFEKLKSVGVTVKILTGDNELVTNRICKDLNLDLKKGVSGDTIDALSEDKLQKEVVKNDIFTRLAPRQKERIIKSLREAGYVVGFMGDGINDAPSLRAADIGISVENAVDIARESADLILLRKDLLVLSDGIHEGRKMYGNIMKYIMMGTSSDFGNMVSVAVSSLFLPFLPMLPAQIFLNDLLYDVTQFSISSDNVNEQFLQRPKKWDIAFIKRFMLVFGFISSIFDFLTFLILMVFFHSSASLFQTGWFIESVTTQALIVLSIRTAVSPFFKSKPSVPLLGTIIGVVALAWFLPFFYFSKMFAFTAPPLVFYLLLLPLVGLYFVMVELAKRWFYKRYQLA